MPTAYGHWPGFHIKMIYEAVSDETGRKKSDADAVVQGGLMKQIVNINQQLIMPEEQTWFGNCHSSTIVKVGKNEYLSAYMAGECEGKPDMAIWISRCVDGIWLQPEKIMGVYRFPHWNPVLYFDGTTVTLIFKVGPSVPLWYSMISESKDLGKTWSVPREAVPGDYQPRITSRNKIIRGSNGYLYGPCSIETEKYWDSYIDISKDNGRTWSKHAIPFNHDLRQEDKNGGSWNGLAQGALWENDLSTVLKWDGIIQPTIWESSAGMFHALLRSTRGHIYRTDSTDYGDTWCEAYPTDIPNNNSGIDIAKMDDGTLVLAYNPVSGNWSARSPISLSISEDNGNTFSKPVHLETRDGEFSYPAILADGSHVYMTYTYKRKSIVFCTFDIIE